MAGVSMGIVLSSVINLFNPEMIVLCGGTSRAGKLLLDPIKRTIRRYAFRVPREAARIVLSRRDKDLGVAGAALLI